MTEHTLVNRTRFIRPELNGVYVVRRGKEIYTTENLNMSMFVYFECVSVLFFLFLWTKMRSAEDIAPYPCKMKTVKLCVYEKFYGFLTHLLFTLFGLSLYALNHCWCSFFCLEYTHTVCARASGVGELCI